MNETTTDAERKLAIWMRENACRVGPRGLTLPDGTFVDPNEGDDDCWDNDGKREGAFRCQRCAGTGRFITYCENDVLKGPGGICFRCQGKGYHTQRDRRRNYGADMNQRVY